MYIKKKTLFLVAATKKQNQWNEKKRKCKDFLRGQTGTQPISCQVSKDNRIKGQREKENKKEVSLCLLRERKSMVGNEIMSFGDFL